MTDISYNQVPKTQNGCAIMLQHTPPPLTHTDHITNMAHALKTAEKSPHPTHKVGALLSLTAQELHHSIACYNDWPETLARHIGKANKLGNASNTLHAEIATLCKAQIATHGASLYLTNLPCPNCTKALSEAGIADIYFDSNAYNTPLGLKMRTYFEQASKLILKQAGKGLHEINLDHNTIRTLLRPAPFKTDTQKTLKAQISRATQEIFSKHFENARAHFQNDPAPFTATIAKDKQNKTHYFLAAQTCYPAGLEKRDIEHIHTIQDKYEAFHQPFNRLLSHCAFHGLRIEKQYLRTTQIPTAREFVNMIGYSIRTITIENKEKYRDASCLEAYRQLKETGTKIIEIL
ncbi:MAG: deaminase [Alphaproteobacteria bacterium]